MACSDKVFLDRPVFGVLLTPYDLVIDTVAAVY